MRQPIPHQPPDLTLARELTDQLIRTGLVLTDMIASLIEDLPEDAYPGEENGMVLLEMVAGSSVPAVAAAGERTVREATALIAAVQDRVVSDLREAARLARAREASGR
ncbi:hypothetical protein HJD18_11280 [Thermoleophilia bacterium SCSIO 60948]|nr:hypothetical protein HJD18_11280 [Thermoleophilia bacterium SCSIO 60948]